MEYINRTENLMCIMCGIPNLLDNRISTEGVVPYVKYPWVAVIQNLDLLIFPMGINSPKFKNLTFQLSFIGSIIDERHIIIPAGSASKYNNGDKRRLYNPENFTVYLETINLKSLKNPLIVEEIIFDNYDGSLESNLALLRLRDPIEFSRTVRPICVPRTLIPRDSKKTLKVTVLVFRRNPSQQLSSMELREGEFILRVKDECKKLEDQCLKSYTKEYRYQNYDDKACILNDKMKERHNGFNEIGSIVQHWNGYRWDFIGFVSDISRGRYQNGSYCQIEYITKADQRKLFDSTPHLCNQNIGSKT